MSKRKHDNSDYIQRKIRKLEKKLSKQKGKLNAGKDSTIFSDEDTCKTPPLTVLGSENVEEPPQPGTSAEQPEYQDNDPGTSVNEDLPEEFLMALGDEGKLEELKGPTIRQEIADRWTNIIKLGIKKDSLRTILNKYPTPANFDMAEAPKLNQEIVAAVSETVLKRDKRFQTRQDTMGRALSCLGGLLSDIMKGNINSVKLIEGINDAAKILCNMNHLESLTRRHFILTSVQSCVKQAIADAPIDNYLLGENFSERLKVAKAVERSGSTIKQPQTFKKQGTRFQPPATSTSRNLNWKSPSRRGPAQGNNFRGGQKKQQIVKRTYKPQQGKPQRRR